MDVRRCQQKEYETRHKQKQCLTRPKRHSDLLVGKNVNLITSPFQRHPESMFFQSMVSLGRTSEDKQTIPCPVWSVIQWRPR
jgi:hypothetical protein